MTQRDGLIGSAREMRSNPTEAERTLWEALRRKQVSSLRFRRQRVIGPYIVDFCCLEKGLIVEVDGGHHSEAEMTAYDAARTEYLEALGFSVTRVSNAAVMRDVNAVVRGILDGLRNPNSPKQGPQL